MAANLTSTAASAELRCLNPFVGVWDTEGVVRGGPGTPGPFTATDSYEWLAGGRFLLHRFDADMPDGRVQGIEVIGYDPDAEGYSVHSYDSSGNADVMQARVEGDTWSFAGDGVRFIGRFRNGGQAFDGLWELRSSDGAGWQPWMDVRLTKAGPP